jgi:hypothetical protein
MFKRYLVSTVLGMFLVLPVLAQAQDLSGIWTPAGAPQLRLQAVQRGNEVTMTYLIDECQTHDKYSSLSCANVALRQDMKGAREDSFHKGDVFLVGRLVGSGRVEGKIRFFITKSSSLSWRRWRELCGDNYQYMADARLNLSPDGSTLKGEHYSIPRDASTCRPTGNNRWVSEVLVRVGPPPPAKAKNDDWWKSPEDKSATKPSAKPRAEPPPKPAAPKPVAAPPPAELPKVEAPPPPPPVATPPAPVVMPPDPASGKNLALGGGLLALLSAVFFFIRNAWVNYLVGSLKRSPNNANLSGWAMFGGFVLASAMGSLALAGSEWLSGPVFGALGGLSAACFGLCAMFSAKK